MISQVHPLQEHDQKPVHEEVVTDHHENPTRTVAIAVDSSECSKYAFDWAVENLLRPESDQVVLLNVRGYILSPVLYGIPTDIDEYHRIEDQNRLRSHELLRAYAKQLVAKNIKCRGIALKGDARDEIVAKVNDLKASMLVIGTRGMGTVKRALVGSVSDYCVHHANCPVVVPRK